MKFILSFLILLQISFAQNKFTLNSERENFKEELIAYIDSVSEAYAENGSTVGLEKAFWGAGLLLYKSNKLKYVLESVIKNAQLYQENIIRPALEAIITCYPVEFIPLLNKLPVHNFTPKTAAMVYVYLAKSGISTQDLLKKLANDKSLPPENPFSEALNRYLKDFHTSPAPDLSALFSYSYSTDVIFSLQYKDRNKPGFVLLKSKTNGFIKNSNGTLVTINQLARSLSDMPGFLTNGNTPQGIFRIWGIDTSTNNFIGNTPNLQLALPHEIEAQLYFSAAGIPDKEYSHETYLSIAPPEFRTTDSPLLEAYTAGKVGRTEIIAHGTATDIYYYKNKSYYPYTPTLGCLCMKEIWSEETGQLVESDQKRFMDIVTGNNITNGYLIVIEIPDSISPENVTDYLP